MKKFTLLVFILTLFVSEYKAQKNISQNILDKELNPLPNASYTSSYDSGTKKSLSNTKVFGDTLFYEDFNGGIPNGWNIVNNNANSSLWQWDTTYKAGALTQGVNTINSTTAANGFMSLPSDFYNTPVPPTGAILMDTYFESDSIIIPANTTSVWLSYQQFLLYCCSSTNRLVLQVSTDNFLSFTEFDATGNLSANEINASNAQAIANNVINISCALQGATNFRIRFLSAGNSHYFWMIDDLAIIEGSHNDLELSNNFLEFNSPRYFYNPFYHQIPHDFFTPLSFSANIKNNGDLTQTNTRLEASVTHTAFPNGSGGQGLVYYQTQNISSGGTIIGNHLLACDSLESVTIATPSFVPLVTGNFRVDWLANSDSLDQNLGNEAAVDSFMVGDTIFARDDNTFGGGTGPASYVNQNSIPGGTVAGDRFGTMYIVESRTGTGVHTIPSSVTFRVSNNIRNVGVEIIPKIWRYVEDSLVNGIDAAFQAEVASSFIPYTVGANALDTFITLKFDNGTALTNGMDSGQYVVGWEVTSVSSNTTFEVLNDASSAARQELVSTFLYFGHDPGWGWVRDNPGIRLNLKDLPLYTSLNQLNDSNLELSILPNPTEGEFELKVKSDKQDVYIISIKNALGQTVFEEQLNVSGTLRKQFDFKHLEKGIYFISIQGSNNEQVKKIVIS